VAPPVTIRDLNHSTEGNYSAFTKRFFSNQTGLGALVRGSAGTLIRRLREDLDRFLFFLSAQLGALRFRAWEGAHERNISAATVFITPEGWSMAIDCQHLESEYAAPAP
jgi:hypothetical protein